MRPLIALLLLLGSLTASQAFAQGCSSGGCSTGSCGVGGGGMMHSPGMSSMAPAPPLAVVEPRPVPDHIRQAIVRLEGSYGDRLGTMTGTMIEKDANSALVVTAAHGYFRKPDTLVAIFPDGRKYPAEVISVDNVVDLATVRVAGSPVGAPIRLASTFPPVGARVASYGYGGDFRLRGGLGTVRNYVSNRVPGSVNGDIASGMYIEGRARKGDSGGPIFDQDWNLVGVIYATNGRTMIEGTEIGHVSAYVAQFTGPYRKRHREIAANESLDLVPVPERKTAESNCSEDCQNGEPTPAPPVADNEPTPSYPVPGSPPTDPQPTDPGPTPAEPTPVVTNPIVAGTCKCGEREDCKCDLEGVKADLALVQTSLSKLEASVSKFDSSLDKLCVSLDKIVASSNQAVTVTANSNKTIVQNLQVLAAKVDKRCEEAKPTDTPARQLFYRVTEVSP